MYALPNLLLLQDVETGIAHWSATLHNPPLESSGCRIARRRGEAGRALGGVLLRVAHQFEPDGPRPGNGEGETALAEDGLRPAFGAAPRCRRSEYVRPCWL